MANNQILEKVLIDIRSKRFPSFSTRADVRRIMAARESGEWVAVHGSRLYRNHSGEYCQLLEIVSRNQILPVMEGGE